MTALDGTGQRLEADVKGAAIAGHTQDCHIVPALDFQGLGNARGKRGQAHEHGLHRGDTPSGLIAAAREYGRTARRGQGNGLGA